MRLSRLCVCFSVAGVQSWEFGQRCGFGILIARPKGVEAGVTTIEMRAKIEWLLITVVRGGMSWLGIDTAPGKRRCGSFPEIIKGLFWWNFAALCKYVCQTGGF